MLVFMLSACASKPTHWQHSSNDRQQAELDALECQSRARNKAEKEYLFREAERPRAGIDFYSGLEGDVSKFEAKKRSRAYFETCMKYKGYRPMKADEKKA